MDIYRRRFNKEFCMSLIRYNNFYTAKCSTEQFIKNSTGEVNNNQYTATTAAPRFMTS